MNNEKHIWRYNKSKVNQANPLTNAPVQKRPKWVKTSHRSANTHDVRAILCIGKKVNMKPSYISRDVSYRVSGA